MKKLSFLTRAGCHLCEEARAVVEAVVARTGAATIEELDVDQDPELRAEYGDQVPVVLIDGVQHGYFTIDAGRLERALRA
ncbi:glutaredoxin [Nakamurella sp. UYEF19]|uniref:glutaredoxin family protein n=1 Tax=Nakamurella sp. UYEF19 TaxID=1756392 RepID=UPI00339592DC